MKVPSVVCLLALCQSTEASVRSSNHDRSVSRDMCRHERACAAMHFFLGTMRLQLEQKGASMHVLITSGLLPLDMCRHVLPCSSTWARRGSSWSTRATARMWSRTSPTWCRPSASSASPSSAGCWTARATASPWPSSTSWACWHPSSRPCPRSTSRCLLFNPPKAQGWHF